MRVAVIENMPGTLHGQIGVALHEGAAKVDVYRPFQDGRLPNWGDHDALVSFGGAQNARDDDAHPYLADLAVLMRETALSGRATLGICLGSQVFARGLGADNLIGAAPEFGWCTIDLLEAARDDPLLGALPARFRSFQWHSDTFTLPQDAVHLARSDAAPAQAFRIGRAGYATQFHFEAHRGVVRQWCRDYPDTAEDMRAGWAQAHDQEEAAHAAAADDWGLHLARAWVSLI